MPRRTSVLFFCDLDVVLSNLDGSVEVIYYHNYLELFCYICYNNTGDTNNPQFSYSHSSLYFTGDLVLLLQQLGQVFLCQ